MTDEHYRWIQQLAGVRWAPATWNKRFVRDLAAKPKAYELSPKQIEALTRLAYRYRRARGEPDMPRPAGYVSPEEEAKTEVERRKLAEWNAAAKGGER